MSDAWLGVHATGGDRPAALAAMIANVSRFGVDRQRCAIGFHSRVDIGAYVSYRLESHAELWAARAAADLTDRRWSYASAAIGNINGLPSVPEFLAGRLAYMTDNLDSAIDHLRRSLGVDRFIDVEARLLLGICLARRAVWEPALVELRIVSNQTTIRAASHEARYFRALVARARGDEDNAMQLLHAVYAQRPTLDGLVEAIRDPSHGLNLDPIAASVQRSSLARVRSEVNTVEEQDIAEHDEPEARRVDPDAPGVIEVLEDIGARVGHADIKAQVNRLVAQVRARIARERAGLAVGRLTEHLVFTGPPGTGKTSVARDIARLYHALGILDGDTVVEVDRSGLVGEYLGATAIKTSEVIDSALGGVLFIDEAYSLHQSGLRGGDAFGREAIDTLVKRMEDERDRMVVIIAGYDADIDRFLGSNPGLGSRFTTRLTFTTYDPADLVEIATLIASATDDQIAPDALPLLRNVFEHASRSRLLDELGNARLARNLIETAARHRDHRLFAAGKQTTNVDAADLTMLTRADIRTAGLSLVPPTPTFR